MVALITPSWPARIITAPASAGYDTATDHPGVASESKPSAKILAVVLGDVAAVALLAALLPTL